MATYGFNFRQTSGYVTDVSPDTYVLHSDSYPTTRNGVTFGWEVAPRDGRNRNSGIDAKLAGINFTDKDDISEFRIDLTGGLKFRAAFGDYTAPQSLMTVEILDDATSKVTPISGVSTLAQEWYDATGVLRSGVTTWVNNNAQSAEYSFSSHVLVKLTHVSGTSNAATIAHLEIEEQAAAGGGYTNALSLMGVG